MDTLTISTKAELATHEPAIAQLFRESFGSELSPELWRWAYLDNPHGEPQASLCFDEGTLVGHYAMIPMPLTAAATRRDAYLSMTTMVATTHRKHGLFTTLAQDTYDAARRRGIDFVMGFPNAMSTPGFRRRLDWNLPPADYVATLTKSDLLAAARALPLAPGNRFRLDLSNPTTRSWRLGKPGATYHWVDGLAYKDYGNAVDLMAFDQPEQLTALPEDRLVNLLVPAMIDALRLHQSFDYQFGGLSLASAFEPEEISRQMALSDVF